MYSNYSFIINIIFLFIKNNNIDKTNYFYFYIRNDIEKEAMCHR